VVIENMKAEEVVEVGKITNNKEDKKKEDGVDFDRKRRLLRRRDRSKSKSTCNAGEPLMVDNRE
jgi:hypothetical protein